MKKLPENVHRVMDETYYQRLKKPIKAIELPCTKHHKWGEPVMVQINEARDQTIACPLCGRKHHLIWSKLGNHKYA